MGRQVDFRQEVAGAMSNYLWPLGYELIEDPPGFRGGGLVFFRKHLVETIYTFVCFEISWQVMDPYATWPVHYTVTLWRNKGKHPRRGHGEGESFYANWLYLDLSFLLWSILDVKVLSGLYHKWASSSTQQLRSQLSDVGEKLVQYGIPWLEDLGSRNPYDSWP